MTVYEQHSAAVDSIRWVRNNCILLGCFQLIDGREENYLVQVIRSPDGKISDVSNISFALILVLRRKYWFLVSTKR